MQNTKSKQIKSLFCAVLLRAVQDYCGDISETTRGSLPDYYFDRDIIMKDLESDRLFALTDGMSLTVANALKNNENLIKDKLGSIIEDYELIRKVSYGKPDC